MECIQLKSAYIITEATESYVQHSRVLRRITRQPQLYFIIHTIDV